MSNDSSNPLELRFSIGPFPITVEPWFWLLSVVMGASLGRFLAPWVVICFVSVLLHELGHGTTALVFGARSHIRLHSFGGLCIPDRQLSRWRDLAMSAAGPAVNFLLWGLAEAILAWAPPPTLYMRQVLRLGGYINWWWGILNMLPVLPLDGGHVLAGLFGPSRRRAVRMLGAMTAACAVAYAVANQDFYFAAFFALMGVNNLQALSGERDVRAQRPPAREPDALSHGWRALLRGDEYEASRLAHQTLSGAKDPAEQNGARDLLAWIALAEDTPRAAVAQLELVVPRSAGRSLTWAMALDALKQYPEAARYAREAVEKEPSETSAILAVRLLLQTGQVDEAERVIQGFTWPIPATRDARLADVAFARGQYEAAATLYATAYQEGRRSYDAYNAACGHARAGQFELATAWLKRALEAGFDDLEKVANDPNLAQIRTSPEIAPLLKSLPS